MTPDERSSEGREWKVLDDFAGYTRVEYNGWKLLIDCGMDEAADFCRMANRRLTATQSELEGLRAALEKYGLHLNDCPANGFPRNRCTCGFDALTGQSGAGGS